MFGLLGAYWADVLFNYCSRGTLRHAGVGGLLFATVPNLVIGLTPSFGDWPQVMTTLIDCD
jgi:hypothetical protein